MRKSCSSLVTTIRVHVLGHLRVSGVEASQLRLSRSARRMLAMIAAAGPDGINRDALATELWGPALPESWKSAIRNRVASARKSLGAHSLISEAGRVSFAPFVRVDSWELINHELAMFEADDELAFLEGEPLVGIEPSPLLLAHSADVTDARASLVQQLVDATPEPISPRGLQTLRTYQRRRPLDSIVTEATVRAHAQAGEENLAAKIIDEVNALAHAAPISTTAWIRRLDSLVTPDPKPAPETVGQPLVSTDLSPAEIAARSELFHAAARDQEWSVAMEIAVAGLPEAERIDGDPERVKLLEQIPLEKLDPSRRLPFCLTLTTQLMYAGREAEALQWSKVAREVAQTPDEQLRVYVNAAIVGDSVDERTPLPLPAGFDSVDDENINMQSLQVAVMSHLERASVEEAAPLKRRFDALVESSADPYRRWLMMLLGSMTHFVDGDFSTARHISERAHKYANVCGIASAEVGLVGQRSNAHWVCPEFDGIENIATEYPAMMNKSVAQALAAAALAEEDGGEAANEFLRSFDFHSQSVFVFPTFAIVAGSVTDPVLREAVVSRLQQRAGTSTIWGTGVLHLGPVDRMLARLVVDPQECEQHLVAALRVADRQRTRLWQIVCRRDLAQATGNKEHDHRAQALVTTPELQRLFERYPGLRR